MKSLNEEVNRIIRIGKITEATLAAEEELEKEKKRKRETGSISARTVKWYSS